MGKPVTRNKADSKHLYQPQGVRYLYVFQKLLSSCLDCDAFSVKTEEEMKDKQALAD